MNRSMELLEKHKQFRTRLLSLNRKNPWLPQGLCTCNNKTCKLCALYIKLCTSFKIPNDALGSITCHITCQSKTVIYFLKCTFYSHGTTYIGKSVYLRSRKNNHITSRRLGGSTGKFDNHVFYCMQNQKKNCFFKY